MKDYNARLLLASLCLTLAACGDTAPEAAGPDTVDTAAPDLPHGLDGDPTPDLPSPDGEQPGDTATESTPTWHGQVLPLIERHCASCHAEGAMGGFALDDYDLLTGLRPLIVGHVLAGTMPPWPMDPECRDVLDARIMTQAERDTFAAWRDGGYQRGDEGDYAPLPARPAARDDIGASDAVLVREEPYVADRDLGDDYRCFIYEHDVTEDTWVSGANVLPDAQSIVHHALVYIVPPHRVASVTQRDARHEGLGYPCLGGVGAGGEESLLAGWVPGMLPMHFPADSAFRVEAGSRFVVQMHYNTLNIAPSEAIPADATSIEIWTLPTGVEPERRVHIQAIADIGLNVRAGESHAVAGTNFTSPANATIIGVIPHMHTLGKEISVTVHRAQSDATECLAHIPNWDFHWQQVYQYSEGDHVPLNAGDTVQLRCIYDNSPENQPIIGGVQQEPRDVRWGEGTLDEMCLTYLVTSFPHGGSGRALCHGVAPCITDCPEGDALCALQCVAVNGNDCAGCAIQGLFAGCGQQECPSEFGMLAACIGGCSTPSDILGCATGECRAQLDTLYACVEPAMRAGECDDHFADCDLSFGEQ